MTQRYDDILAFLEVVKAGSFTAAGARLALAKSVISDRVRNLENALGVELLRRTTRSVTPTERGAELFDSLNPLVQALDEAVDTASAAHGPLTGRLRMSAPISFGMRYLTPVIAGFARAHPQLEIALDFDDRAVDIIGAGYDLALRIGRLTDSSLMARKLCDSDRVVCCSPAYAKQHGLPKSVEDLAQHATIDYANLHASRLWRFEPAAPGGEPRVVETSSRIVVNNGEAMRDMAMAGLGIIVLPRFIVAEALNSGALVEALPDICPVPDAIYAVYPPTRHMPRKLRAMVDHLAAGFAGTPPWLAAKPVAKAGKPRRA
ncbi:MAG: LysR family transcriptional regulator [Ferrovibrio sp.]|uniref:LysR family transcriptional regulator n=1 Tax=Ferrovibrio sp. TaxID=1917215 RepID=UPI00262E4C0C|nr:LysR family transcriptional regulator [Ferrovibrio sp.]MCW0232778.1 LysR family transcriptional regulator [Ferrovibrio sp.]